MRTSEWRRLTAAIAVVSLLMGLVAGVVREVAPAGAQSGEPTLVVEPAEIAAQSGEVEVTWDGIPVTESTTLGQCSAVVVTDPDADPADNCRSIWEVREPSRTITATVFTAFPAVSGRRIVCADEPGGCVVAIGSLSPRTVDAWVPISLPPPARVTLSRTEGVAYGEELEVTITDLEPGAAYGVHICRDAYWTPDACEGEPEVQVVADAQGAARATVVAPLAPEGSGVTCAFAPCAVGTIGDSGAIVVGLAGYLNEDAHVTLTPDTDVLPGQPMRVDATGLLPGRRYEVRRCVGTGGSMFASDCETASGPVVQADADGTASATIVAASGVDTGTEVRDCQVWPCSVGVVLEGTDWVVGSLSYFLSRATVTLTPAGGFVDGQEATVRVEGLRPGGAYHLRRCDAEAQWAPVSLPSQDYCEHRATDPAIVAGPDGTATASIAVAQRIEVTAHPRGLVCRPQACAVAVVDDEFGALVASVRYDMAQAQLTATPDTGLADRQRVALSGTGLMASYAGPRYWILPTGAWGVGQCAAEVGGQPSIADVFRSCAPVSGLHVPGSTFELGVRVRAHIEPVVGDPVDCTTGPGACVLAVMRVESDGLVTLHSVPISFS